jgi:hypothetical protein
VTDRLNQLADINSRTWRDSEVRTAAATSGEAEASASFPLHTLYIGGISQTVFNHTAPGSESGV